MKLDSYVTLYTRVHSRLNIYIRYNAIKNASKKPIGQSYVIFGLDNEFLYRTTKGQATKRK